VRKALTLAFALTGCGQSAGNGPIAAPANQPASAPAGPVQTRTLTGLYETAGARPGQICIVEQGRSARFGLVTWQGERSGCSGAGVALRSSGILHLTMDGESACLIEALIDGPRVTFPTTLPRGCSYYCAPGAPLAGVAFAKRGGTREDALRARDLVGDPLCG
jgi:hypothetical protein